MSIPSGGQIVNFTSTLRTAAMRYSQPVNGPTYSLRAIAEITQRVVRKHIRRLEVPMKDVEKTILMQE